MQLARIDTPAGARCVARLADGGWTAVSDLVPDLPADDPVAALGAAEVLRSALAGRASVAAEPEPPRLRCPLPNPGKVLCIGLNYREHIAETKGSVPAVPVLFAKYANAMNGPYDPIPAHPSLTQRLDYEGELAVVIGRRTRAVSEPAALAAVGGYAVANDVSARDRQFGDGGQWTHSKTFDGFCPLGPWLTTAEEVPDPQALELTTHVNGEQRQHTSTGDMVFPVAALVSYLSQGITLEPGDLVLTGTPSGVALGRADKPWLRPGDRVQVAISGLGAIDNVVGG